MAIAAHLGIGISLHNYMHCNHAKATRHAHVNSAQQHAYTLRSSLQVATSIPRPVKWLRCLQHL